MRVQAGGQGESEISTEGGVCSYRAQQQTQE